MTAIELNAMRGELARDILNTDNLNVLNKVRRAFKRALKAEEQEEYIEKEEVLEQIREGMIEVKKRYSSGKKGQTLQDFINEL